MEANSLRSHSKVRRGEPSVNCLFWNIQGKDLAENLVEIVWEHSIDILILAECDAISVGRFLTSVNAAGRANLRFHDSAAQKKIRIFTNLPARSVVNRFDTGGVSIRHIKPPLTDD